MDERIGLSVQIQREIQALRQCDSSPHVVGLREVISTERSIVLVLEKCDFDLSSIITESIEQAIPIPVSIRKALTHQLLVGISHIHSQSLVHNDLKPQNIFLCTSGYLKIGDFGLCSIIDLEKHIAEENFGVIPYDNLLNQAQCTRWYRSPEQLYGDKSNTPAMDVWAAGLIIAEMERNCAVFHGHNDIDQLASIIRDLGPISTDNWPELDSLPDYGKINFNIHVESDGNKDWIRKLLPKSHNLLVDMMRTMICYSSSKRWSANQLLQHPYFTEPPLPSHSADVAIWVTKFMKNFANTKRNLDMTRMFDISKPFDVQEMFSMADL